MNDTVRDVLIRALRDAKTKAAWAQERLDEAQSQLERAKREFQFRTEQFDKALDVVKDLDKALNEL